MHGRLLFDGLEMQFPLSDSTTASKVPGVLPPLPFELPLTLFPSEVADGDKIARVMMRRGPAPARTLSSDREWPQPARPRRLGATGRADAGIHSRQADADILPRLSFSALLSHHGGSETETC